MTVPLGPAPLDITGVRAGDLNEFQLTITSGGRALDLTGQTITASARLSKDDVDSLDAVITVVDEVKGVIKVRWPGEDVRTWLGTELSLSGVWDLQAGELDADPITLLAGTFTAELDVTR